MNLNSIPNEAIGIVQAISRTTNIPLYKPSKITLDMTDRCQLECQTCSKWKTLPTVISKELTTNDWKRIITALKVWLGPFWFTFSGGEPLLRKDLFELATYAVEQKTHPALITNGYGFHSLVGKIVASGLESVTVSLNGINPLTHDTTRGVKGAFEKTEKFIKELNKARQQSPKTVRLSINTILLPANYMEVAELVNWVQEEGLDGVHFQPMDPPGCFHSAPIKGINLSSLEGAGGEWYKENFEKTTTNNLASSIKNLVKLKTHGAPILNSVGDLKRIEEYYSNPQSIKNRCLLGVSSYSIDPYGYVRFCFNMDSIGNAKDESPSSLFLSRNALKARIQIKQCSTPCHWAVI